MKISFYYFYLVPVFFVSWNPFVAIYAYSAIFLMSALFWLHSGFLNLEKHEYAMLAFAIAALMSVVINSDFDQTFLALYLLSPMALIGFRRACLSLKNWYYVGLTYVIGCVFLSFQILYSVMFDVYVGERATISGLNGNYVAYCLAMGSAVIVALVSVVRGGYVRNFVFAAMFVMMLYVVLLTGSRGALMSIGFLCLVNFIFLFRSRPYASILVVMVFILIANLLYTLLPEYLVNRLLYGDDSLGDVSSGRFAAWNFGYEVISNNFFTGVGPGVIPKINPNNIPLHNAFLSVFAEVGFFGFIAYIIGILSMFFSLYFSRDSSPQSRYLGTILLVTWLPIAMTGVWEVSLAAWFLFGWFIAILRPFSKI